MLTSDVDWDPTILDNDIDDDEEWSNPLEDLPTLPTDPLFNDFADYCPTNEVTEAIMSDSIIENNVITDLPSVFQLYANEVKPRPIDYNEYQLKFAWIPCDIIEKTFQNTASSTRRWPQHI